MAMAPSNKQQVIELMIKESHLARRGRRSVRTQQ